MLLTGPNMGGKSTVLREACLLVLLAQLGCRVPAEAMRLTPVDAIFTRCGASDRILRGESTFFVELAEASSILEHATSRSLVVMDELGRGTSTHDGHAIAAAVLEHLVGVTQCLTLFSSHHSGLMDLGGVELSLHHMACALDPDAGVVFLYQLAPGVCLNSRGVNVAKMAALPEGVTTSAAAKSRELLRVQTVRGIRKAVRDGDARALARLQKLWRAVSGVW